jgi:hypothetical protein
MGKIPPKSKMLSIAKEIAKHTTNIDVAYDVFGTFYKGIEFDVFEPLWAKTKKAATERDVGQAFGRGADPNARLASTFDAGSRPLEAKERAKKLFQRKKIKKEVFDYVIAAANKRLHKQKSESEHVSEFDRLSGRDALPEHRLVRRELADVTAPISIVRQKFSRDGGLVLAARIRDVPFSVQVDGNGKTTVHAEDLSAVPASAQMAVVRKARLAWWAEQAKPRGFAGTWRLEAEEKLPKPKFKFGDRVKMPGRDAAGTIWKAPEWDDYGKFYRYRVKRDSGGFLYVNEDSLKPLSTEAEDDEQTPANIIWQQLGKARMMIGAKNPISSNGGKTLGFKIGRNSKAINGIRITLDPSDTYTMEFMRGTKVVNKIEDVYADSMHDMIEKYTGLYVRL